MFDIRHLRYFLAVAEEGNVTRAAEQLGLQQPPLSQQIKALEQELDVQLFRRKPRGMELTDAGRALQVDAKHILGHMAKARAKVERTARGEQGNVVVGFTSSAPFHPFLPRLFRLFGERFPHVSLTLEEHGTTELVEGLRAETIDAAFVRSPVAESHGLSVHAISIEPMFVALPNNHPLAPVPGVDNFPPLALEDLADEPFILYRRHTGPGFYDLIIAACNRAGFTPKIAQEAPRLISTLNLVAAGLGVTLAPESLRSLQLEGVAYRSLKSDPGLTAPLNLACRAVDHSAAARRFVEMARAEARATKAAKEDGGNNNA
ncbi:MAG: LysR family transcriptional regulator [Alphaproteobacteria bacterium]|nr:LysR family transcriptional regulator [Alphaproteobacteria bacterium]